MTSVVVLAFTCNGLVRGQKTSTWTGQGTDPSWSDSQNWDTSEDPNGGDTAIVNAPASINLDANRTLGTLQLNGQLGSEIGISGSSQLTVSSALTWTHAALSGAGSFLSANSSNVTGLADFGGWNGQLSGTNTFNADFRTGNLVLIGGNTEIGTSQFRGEGRYAFGGSVTKNTVDPSHISLINPWKVTVTGTVTATSGVINFNPEKVDDLEGATFITAANGRIRFTSDDVTYKNVTFTNNGRMDITDEIAATERSIALAGDLISNGSEPVVLGSNSKMEVSGFLEGKWLMRANELLGSLSTSGTGFVWESGKIGPSLSSYDDFTVKSGGGSIPTVIGEWNNRGHVVQDGGSLRIAEGVTEIEKKIRLVPGKLDLQGNSIYELQNAGTIAAGVFSESSPPKIESESLSAVLRHTATSGSTTGTISIDTELGCVIQNTGGRLNFTGVNEFEDASFKVENAQELGSEIRLTGTSKLEDCSVSLTDGGVLTLAERSAGTVLKGKLTGSGDGKLALSEGTLTTVVSGFLANAAVIDFPTTDDEGLDPEDTTAAVFEISRANASAPIIAINIQEGLYLSNNDPANPVSVPIRGRLRVIGNVDWSGGVITSLDADGFLSEDPLLDGVLENRSTNFRILTGNGATRFERAGLFNTAGGIIYHGAGTSPILEFEEGRFTNEGLYDFDGNGRINRIGDEFLSLLKNEGVIRKSSGTGTSLVALNLKNETGTVESLSGTLRLNGSITEFDDEKKTLSSGTYRAVDGGKIRFGQIDRVEKLGDQATIEVSGAGSQILNETGALLFDRTDLILLGDSVLSVKDLAVVDIGGDLTANGGTVSGDGTIDADNVIISEEGTISPGNSPGVLQVVGNLGIQPGGRYLWEASSTSSDGIDVDGDVTISGTFTPVFLDGFVPALNATYTILTADSITGSFDAIDPGPSGYLWSFEFINTGTELQAKVVASDYQNWLSSHFTAGEQSDLAISGFGADPDLDGIDNFFEYAFGFDPRSGDGDPFSINVVPAAEEGASDTVEISFPWAVADAYELHSSSDLEEWNLVAPEDFSLSVEGSTHRLSVEQSLDNPTFYRLVPSF